MEEIQGTEVLEREITDEAVKKAERLTRQAKEQIEGAASRMKMELETGLAALRAEAAVRVARYEGEVRSRLPLERTRIRVVFLDTAIRKNLRAWVDSLDEAALARWCGRRLVDAASSIAGGAWTLRYRGISEALVAAMAESAAGAVKPALVRDPELPDRGVIAERADGSARLKATSLELEEELVESRRGELAAALYPALTADPATDQSAGSAAEGH